MANLTKEQLLEKDYAELQALAEQMNILNYMDKSQDDLIYSILDAQADNSASSETPATPRKRTRIIKKNDADHIFSTDLSHQKIESPVVSEPAPAEPATVEAEFPASEVAEPATAENANDAVAEDAADTLQTEVVEAPKRKRGRPSKADIAAREAALLLSEEMEQNSTANRNASKILALHLQQNLQRKEKQSTIFLTLLPSKSKNRPTANRILLSKNLIWKPLSVRLKRNRTFQLLP